MILTDTDILREIEQGSIVIDPFSRGCLGSNSYDIHLGNTLAVYTEPHLDAKINNPITEFTIPDSGFLMQPNELYLGVTSEYTETHSHIPFLEGKSSVGRLGIDIHATAGKGDIGYCNTWTLEISVKKPVKVYAGMPIGQLIYFTASGPVITLYKDKPSAKYTSRSDRPVSSKMYKNF
ncbi:MAG: dCTP deaminase [Proteobacteria bacterium]|nr:dCTP deaminase [Pseudomonadota bacterium]